MNITLWEESESKPDINYIAVSGKKKKKKKDRNVIRES